MENNNIEIWVDVKDYENYYQVSNYGNIRSKERIVKYSNGVFTRYKGKKRKPSVSEYRMIALSKLGKIKLKKISRLVAIHFIPNIHNKKVVNHIDGNKLNDNINNLEWCTHSENNIHAFDIGLSKSKNKLRGVYYEERRKKWAAYLYRENKNLFIGRFKTELEAINKRNEYLNKYNENKHKTA
tara:strand:- start:749 stop:1297 length:549 start_codon:yes stop_codon:yes gene_type:complete